MFSGNLQRVSPTQDSMHFGPSVPVANPTQYKIGPAPMTLAAGKYQIYIGSHRLPLDVLARDHRLGLAPELYLLK